MTEALPAPLVSADLDLRDFAFMPLDVQRLRDSDLASDETPEACWAAVLLWCASWHQVPAASVPNSDQWLAKQCGYATRGRIDKAWPAVRAGALRGWVLCSDDRLYHPVVAQKARDAWRSKLKQRWATECARIKKHNQRHGTAIKPQEFEEWMSQGCPQGQALFVPEDIPDSSPGRPAETQSKGQGYREGEGEGDREVLNAGSVATPPAAPAAKAPAAAAAAPRGARLPKDWALPKAWGDWALAEFPHWTADIVRRLGQQFRDHWVAKAGKDATKLDWLATWRNWCSGDIAQRQFPPPKAAGNGGKAAPFTPEATAARDAGAARLLGIVPTATATEPPKEALRA